MKTKTSRLISLAGLLLGAAGGYAYYHFVGCANGCPLKSNGPFMTAYGGLLGWFVLETVQEIAGRLRRARRAEQSRAD
ncbi:MAG: hypothetical protein GX444_02565 [Myxococcales bacterium]|nr:hypothetical protein [Myxococcales bacterium]